MKALTPLHHDSNRYSFLMHKRIAINNFSFFVAARNPIPPKYCSQRRDLNFREMATQATHTTANKPLERLQD